MNSFCRPNVLIIYTDQQRLDTLSCYGQNAIQTPNLDALAEDGVRFDRFFVQNPVCGPSRASFLTGRYCSALHVGTNGISFPKDQMTLPKLLKPYGYHTAQLGKLHFEPHARRDHRDPTDTYGFDTFILSDEPGCYDDAYTKWVEMVAPEQLPGVRTMLPPAAHGWGKPSYSNQPRNTHEPYVFEADPELTHTAFVTDQTCSFIRSHPAEQPFFAIAGYYAPHPPLNPPQAYLDRVDRTKLRLPVVGPEEPIDPQLQNMTEEQWKDVAAAYLAMVVQVDDGVGQMVQALREKGIYENTLIVFTSDHGEFLGDHGRIQKWMPGQDCITNVPCIISYPEKIKGGRVCRALTEAVDVVPTILDFCGIQTPSFVQGKSLRDLLLGRTENHRDSVLTELFDTNSQRQTTVRTETHKYYYHENGTELLFDLEKDPWELHNAAADQEQQDALNQMRFVMMKRIQQAAYNGIPPIDAY